MNATTLIVMLGLGGLIAACTPQENLHPSFGNAVHHNMAVQIINPAPIYDAAQQVPALDGPRAVGAQTRYDEGKIIQPERLRTSDSGIGGD